MLAASPGPQALADAARAAFLGAVPAVAAIPTIHAGFRVRVTLEIANLGPHRIRLAPGLPVCQLVFEQVFGTPSQAMRGMFQDQESTAGRLGGPPCKG